MSVPRTRGHRIAGPIERRDFARHYGLDIATYIAIAGVAASAAGTGVSYYSQQQAAQRSSAAGKYNQKIMENQAQQQQYAAQTAASVQRARTARVEGLQRSLTAGSGVTPEGSPLLTMMNTAAQGELDAQRALYTGQVQADSSLAQGAYARWQGRTASRGYEIGAGASLLQGAADIGGRAFQYGVKSRRQISVNPEDVQGY